jgi:4-oxalocrotonate tautomerase
VANRANRDGVQRRLTTSRQTAAPRQLRAAVVEPTGRAESDLPCIRRTLCDTVRDVADLDRSIAGFPDTHSHNRRHTMPLLQVKLIEGVFSAEQKRQMIEKLTETMVSIEGENMRGVTSVVVEEVKSGDWGIGGKALTTADVKALQAGK